MAVRNDRGCGIDKEFEKNMRVRRVRATCVVQGAGVLQKAFVHAEKHLAHLPVCLSQGGGGKGETAPPFNGWPS